MKIISTLLVLFVAVEHFYIAWLEMTQIPSEKSVRAVQHALRVYGTKNAYKPCFPTKACTTASSPSAWYGHALPRPTTPFTAQPSCSSASSSSPPHGARFHPATKAFLFKQGLPAFFGRRSRHCRLSTHQPFFPIELTERMAASTDFSKRFTTTIKTRTPDIHDHSNHTKQSPIPHCRNI